MTAKDRFKKRRKNKRHLAEVLLCPISCMIDIVFLLLIYFVFTFQNTSIEGYANVDIPTVCGPPKAIARIECSVLPGGEYQFNNLAMPLSDIEGHLKRNADAMDTVHLIIKVHPRAKQEEFITILDLCHKLKIKNINLLTLKE